MSDSLFTKEELSFHRAQAMKGITPSLETCAKFIRSIRKSWLAKPDSQTKGKSREKKKPIDEKTIDFF